MRNMMTITVKNEQYAAELERLGKERMVERLWDNEVRHFFQPFTDLMRDYEKKQNAEQRSHREGENE